MSFIQAMAMARVHSLHCITLCYLLRHNGRCGEMSPIKAIHAALHDICASKL